MLCTSEHTGTQNTLHSAEALADTVEDAPAAGGAAADLLRLVGLPRTLASTGLPSALTAAVAGAGFGLVVLPRRALGGAVPTCA
eukprot:1161558-Pelagomonas_calceolata.AAC.3